MRISIVPGKTLTVIDDADRVCGVYHLDDPFKPYVRGLFTPSGLDVVDPPAPDHPHHKGLQFGVCLSDVNFWEESTDAEPVDSKLPIGSQLGQAPATVPVDGGVGFAQSLAWTHDGIRSFTEVRTLTVTAIPRGYAWSWRSELTASRALSVLTSVWPGPGYTGLGVRLRKPLFEKGDTVPPGVSSGIALPSVAYLGNGAAVGFQQPQGQQDVLFLSRVGGEPDFAFISVGPSNGRGFSMATGERLVRSYRVTVTDPFSPPQSTSTRRTCASQSSRL